MGLLKTKQKTNLYITLLPEILMQKIFKQNGIKKRSMKWNEKTNNQNKTIKTKIKE